jgi:hypothetical protein
MNGWGAIRTFKAIEAPWVGKKYHLGPVSTHLNR